MTAWAALLTGLPSASPALVFGRDNRVTVPSDSKSIFGPVGIVYGTPEARYGTAFLVDNCHALTAQHVFGASRSALGRRAIFAAGVSGPFKAWRTSGATVVAEGGLDRRGVGSYGFDRSADWALLRLDKCLGRRFGHVRLTSDVPLSDQPVQMAGYPSDRPLSEGLSVDPDCRIREQRWGMLFHDCATFPGNSGSPLYRIMNEGGRKVLEVFAMNEAGHSFGGQGADLAHPVHEYRWYYANVAAPLCGLLQAVEMVADGRSAKPTHSTSAVRCIGPT
jgi:V8-like Glu-specific endopeptidase